MSWITAPVAESDCPCTPSTLLALKFGTERELILLGLRLALASSECSGGEQMQAVNSNQ